MQCPFERRVAQFAKHGRVADILAHLRQVFDCCAFIYFFFDIVFITVTYNGSEFAKLMLQAFINTLSEF